MFLLSNKMANTSLLILLGLAFATIVQADQSTPKPTYVDYLCLPGSGNYTQGSLYQRNLNTALSILETNSSFASFYEASTGGEGSLDSVYSRYYCRSDLSLRACSSCVNSATKQILAKCSPFKEAIVWYEQCTLLHLNSSARLAYLDLSSPSDLVYIPKNVTNPENFYSVLVDTMNRVINESAYGAGSEGFTTAEGLVSQFQKLYTLTQCSPDRVGPLCERCLRKAMQQIDFCCKEYSEIALYHTSCHLKYSVLKPFYDPPAPPPSRAVPRPPAAAQESDMGSVQTPTGNVAVARSCNNMLKVGVVMAFHTLIFVTH